MSVNVNRKHTDLMDSDKRRDVAVIQNPHFHVQQTYLLLQQTMILSV